MNRQRMGLRILALFLPVFTAAIPGTAQEPTLQVSDGLWEWGTTNPFTGWGSVAFPNHVIPVRVGSFTVKGMSGGTNHSVSLLGDGTVRTWGRNWCGQLGNGTLIDSETPVAVSGLSGVVAVEAGQYHNVALKSDGTVWAWGDNHYGQLGIGRFGGSDLYGELGFDASTVPIQVPSLSGVIAIAAKMYTSLALLADGTVKTWGYNSGGEINGTYDPCYFPVIMNDLSDVVRIKAGNQNSAAVLKDGTLRVWGTGNLGVFGLGEGGWSYVRTPTIVPYLKDVVDVGLGDWFSVVLSGDGTVRTSGDNYFGQLGDGTSIQARATFEIVSALSRVKAIAVGRAHVLAVRDDGMVMAWGCNENGQLGDGTQTNSSIPKQVKGMAGVRAVAAGMSQSLAILPSVDVTAGPTASPNPAEVGQAVRFWAAGVVDPDGTSTKIRYEWDFDGDGDPNRIETDLSGIPSTPTYTYSESGTYAVRVKIFDSPPVGESRLLRDATVDVVVGPAGDVRVWIVQPRDGQTLSGTRESIGLNAVPSDRIDFNSLELQFRPRGTAEFATARAVRAGSASPSARFVWDLSPTGDALAAGVYELRAHVKDVYGAVHASDDAGRQGVVTVSVVEEGDISESETGGRVLRSERFAREAGVDALKVGREGVRVVLPAGGIGADTAVLTIEELGENPGPATGRPELTFHEIRLSAGAEPVLSPRIEWAYRDDDRDGKVDGTNIPVEGLEILHYDAGTGRWDPLPGQTHDREQRRVAGRTSSLSPFVLAGAPVPAASSGGGGGGGGGGCYLGIGTSAGMPWLAFPLLGLGIWLRRRRG